MPNPNAKLSAILGLIPLLGGERAQIVATYHAQTLETIRGLGPRARDVRRALDRSDRGEITPMGMVHRLALLGAYHGVRNEPRVHAAAYQAVFIRAQVSAIAARVDDGEPPNPLRFARQLADARRQFEILAEITAKRLTG